MALLGEIRKRSWLLILLIGIGMLGFLFMDMSGPGGNGGIFGGGQNVGSINGNPISIQKYQNRLNARQNSSINSFEQNKNVWDEFVLESILDEEAQAVGYGVSGKELNDMMIGENVSPMVYRAFANPQTGQLDRASLQQTYQSFKDRSLTTDGQYFMRNLEEQVVLQQKGTKLSSMVSAALYTPKWLAEQQKGAQVTSAEISYVQIPFTAVPDANINISDADLNTYLKNNAHEYKTNEETRTVEYVTFDVVATEDDKSNIRLNLQNLAEEFRNRSDNDNFIQENYGVYDSRYVRKDELNPTVANELFELDNGSVVGPYLDGDYYRITKLIDRQVVPDSVQARHIVRSANPAVPNSIAAARKTIDSLKNLILNKRIAFDTLAVNFGEAGTNTNSDLGMRSAEQLGGLPEVRDLVFYEATKGQLNVVESQFGVHLVEVTKIKSSGKVGARVATISEYIAPSKATQDKMYQEAFAFVRDNRSIDEMRKAAQEKGLRIRKADGLKRNDFALGDLEASESSRNIIKFAFNAKPGEVSPDVFTYDEDAVEVYTSGYVIAALNNIYKAGMPTVDAVRSIITQKVMNQKKGENIAGKIANNTDLAALAAQYGTQENSRNISFPQGLTGEPKVTAAMKGLTNGAISKPIVGNGGVYIIKMNNKTEAAGGDIASLQNVLNNQTRQKMLQSTVLIDALEKKADVSDQRYKYY